MYENTTKKQGGKKMTGDQEQELALLREDTLYSLNKMILKYAEKCFVDEVCSTDLEKYGRRIGMLNSIHESILRMKLSVGGENDN